MKKILDFLQLRRGHLLKKVVFTVVLLLTSSLSFSATWSVYEVQVGDTDVPAVAAALDKFMRSEVGKSMPGAVHLNATLFGGTSRATHAFVLLFPDLATQLDWQASVPETKAGQEFAAAMEAVASPVASWTNSMIKSWGTPSNKDLFYQVTRFFTSDPLAVLAAQEKLMSDPSMAEFPGQVGLSQTAIGNRMGADGAYSTHVFTVGFESIKEMEDWGNYLNTQPAWAEYLRTMSGIATFMGTELVTSAARYDAEMDLEAFLQ